MLAECESIGYEGSQRGGKSGVNWRIQNTVRVAKKHDEKGKIGRIGSDHEGGFHLQEMLTIRNHELVDFLVRSVNFFLFFGFPFQSSISSSHKPSLSK
jgi:hypothetical protein